MTSWLLALSVASGACPERRAEVAGSVAAGPLDEASGLVSSQRPGRLWSHNDSGNAAELVALSPTGEVQGVWPVRATATDWEDIARHGAELVVADIGDNRARRRHVSLWRMEEPAAGATPRPLSATEQRLRYADGPRDAEVLLVHPATGETLILTKGREQEHAIYRVVAGEELMQRVGTIPWLAPTPFRTAGDVAPDGSAVVLRGYTFAWWYAVRPGQTLLQALQEAPCPFALAPETQGEGIAIGLDGVVYTLSEGGDQPLWRYPPPPTPTP